MLAAQEKSSKHELPSAGNGRTAKPLPVSVGGDAYFDSCGSLLLLVRAATLNTRHTCSTDMHAGPKF